MDFLSLFFPGIWVHEGAHALACVVSGVKVHRVEVKTRSGLVVHDASNTRASFLIAFAPLVVGTIISFFLFSSAKHAWIENPLVSVALAWLGASIGFHSIPSYEDVANIPAAVSRGFHSLWSSERGLVMKVLKSAWYAMVWPLSMILGALAWIVNQSILFRLIWLVVVSAIA